MEGAAPKEGEEGERSDWRNPWEEEGALESGDRHRQREGEKERSKSRTAAAGATTHAQVPLVIRCQRKD